MKISYLLSIMLSGLLLSGCAGTFRARSPQTKPQEPVASCSTDARTILSCLAENQKLSRKEFKAVFKTAQGEGGDAASLRLICLSLHEYASYKQFKSGAAALVNYIKNHPEATTSGLEGIHLLMQRIDREMTGKWIQSNKNLEREGLEAENKELLERNEALEKEVAQDLERIRDLQVKLEQLKNIENIIKNREH